MANKPEESQSKPFEPKISTEPLKDLPKGALKDANLPEAQLPKPAAQAGDIFMLGERLTSLDTPDRAVVNVHWKLGYFTDEAKATVAATKNNLVVQPVPNGVERSGV